MNESVRLSQSILSEPLAAPIKRGTLKQPVILTKPPHNFRTTPFIIQNEQLKTRIKNARVAMLIFNRLDLFADFN